MMLFTLQKYKDGVEGYQDWDWIDMYMHKVVPVHNHTFSVRGGAKGYAITPAWLIMKIMDCLRAV